MSYSSNALIDMVEILLSREKSALKCVSNQLRTLLFITKKSIYYCVLSMGSYGTLLKNLRASRAFQVGNLNTAISSFSWQRGIKKNMRTQKWLLAGNFWRDECFIKTLFRVLCCCLLAVCCKGNFQKSLNVWWNVICVVASRLLGGPNSQIFKGTSRRRICIL